MSWWSVKKEESGKEEGVTGVEEGAFSDDNEAYSSAGGDV
jgi:hypothetical protein